MLTSNDLKQIGKLLEPIQTDISGLKTDVSGLKQDMTVVKSDVKTLKKDSKTMQKDIKHIKKNQNFIVDCFEEHTVKLTKRVERIEESIGLNYSTITTTT